MSFTLEAMGQTVVERWIGSFLRSAFLTPLFFHPFVRELVCLDALKLVVFKK